MVYKKKPKISEVVKKSTETLQPRFEFSDEQLQSLKNVSKIALAALGAVALTTVALTAPNVLKVLNKFVFKQSKRRLTFAEKQQKTINAYRYLRRHGLVTFKQSGDDQEIRITKLGLIKLAKYNTETLVIPKPARWNKRWWQVAADIPTHEHRGEADLLRKKLKQLHFYPIQRSLWFYPYNPLNEINSLILHFGIEKYVTIMEISGLDEEDEETLINHFKKLNIL